MSNYSILPAIIAASFVLSFYAQAQELPVRPAAELVEGHFSYFVRGSGAWVQMNEDHVAGEQTPIMWIKRVNFEMAGEIALDRAYAVFEGNTCQPIATIVHSAELDTGRLRSTAVVGNGAYFTSTVTILDEFRSERLIEGHVAVGTVISMREIDDRSNPAVYSTEAYRPGEGGEWVYSRTVNWVFDESNNFCR